MGDRLLIGTDVNSGKPFYVPADLVTDTQGIFGIRGSGKTNDAVLEAEQMIRNHFRVGIIDPLDVWWGLRSSKDGKSAGLPVYIFGGRHQDVPLEESAGKIIAEFICENRIAFILSLRHLSKAAQYRFMVAYGNELYDRNEKKREPLHSFIDEASRYFPQKPFPEVARCLGTWTDIFAEGRVAGLGATIIAQRQARVNKDVLTQCHNLITMQTPGPQDRKAIEAWIEENASNADLAQEMRREMAFLKTGVGYFWNPKNNVFAKVAFNERTTFDSSATPKVGESLKAPTSYARVDLAKLTTDLESTVQRQKENDPAELKRRIAELQKDLTRKHSLTAPQLKTIERIVDRPILTKAQEKQLANLERISNMISANYVSFRVEVATFSEKAAALVAAISQRANNLAPLVASATTKTVENLRIQTDTSKRPAFSGRKVLPATHQDVSIGLGERKILAAIAQHPDGVARDQLTVLTGYKRSSRDTYIQRLRASGYVEVSSDRIVVTENGIAALGNDYEPLPTGDALRAHWMEKLPEGERVILSVLIDAYPKGIVRSDLDEPTGYKRSSRDTYLQRLRSRRLIEMVGSSVRAASLLFD